MNLEELLKTKAGQDPRNRALLESAAKSHSKSAFVGGVGHTQRKPVSVPALESRAKDKRGRESRLVVCIEIIRFGRKPVDDDNLVAGAKPLRDSIARSLGCNDGDTRLYWRYNQVITQASTGTLVRIERLE